MNNKKENKALSVFKTAAKNVPAYSAFLKKNNINPAKIKNIEDFNLVPVVDKKSYIQINSFDDLFPGRKIPPMVSASSGSTGTPTFWFRGDEQEESGADTWEIIIRDIFKIKKNDQTLVINCFSMGVWTAGGHMLSMSRILSKRGYQVSVVTPGIEKGDILNTFKYLAPKFKNLIILGYPPFLMSVIDDVIKRGIVFDQNIRIATSGDKFSEKWRGHIAKLLNITDLNFIISIYGSADAAMLGFETPASIFIRKAALKEKGLYKELFGEEVVTPGLYQHDEDRIYFETVGEEIVLTSDNTIPLVRYNIHDRGKVIKSEEMVDLLDKYGFKKEAERSGIKKWGSSFVVVKGRTDVVTTFYALNIYPENIKAGLKSREVANLVTGNYLIYTKDFKNGSAHKLFINIEVRDDKFLNNDTRQKITKQIVANLLKLNSEYKKLHETLKGKATPFIKLFAKDSTSLQFSIKKGILVLEGKKPRVIN